MSLTCDRCGHGADYECTECGACFCTLCSGSLDKVLEGNAAWALTKKGRDKQWQKKQLKAQRERQAAAMEWNRVHEVDHAVDQAGLRRFEEWKNSSQLPPQEPLRLPNPVRVPSLPSETTASVFGLSRKERAASKKAKDKRRQAQELDELRTHVTREAVEQGKTAATYELANVIKGGGVAP